MDPTLREGANGPEKDATLREGATSGEATLREASTGHVALYPGGLFLSYTLLRPIEVSSGEADLWLVSKGGTEHVLKLYRYGIQPKATMLDKLRLLAGEHVVRLEEHGRYGNRIYEILEKAEHGDLRSLGCPLEERRLKEVLKELAGAVMHLHAQGIRHRDLKPANVLIRSLEPLDLVLTDFGIASLSESTVHLTSVHRTASYGAPETVNGEVSEASDWWSVGVMVLELLKGVHPLAGLTEQRITSQLMTRGIQVPEDLSKDWGELLKGLLTLDHKKRWSGEQVRSWLEGRRGQVTHYEVDPQQVHGHAPYVFCGRKCFTARELAAALSEDWQQGVKNFGRGFLTDWIKVELKNHGLASRLLDLRDDPDLSPDEKLSMVLMELDNLLPPIWKGNVVNREWAARQPEEFLKMLASSLRPRLEKQPGWPAELTGRLSALRDRGLKPEHLAALERVVLTGRPDLKIGDWVVSPDSLTEREEEAVRLLESEVPELQEWLTGPGWLKEVAEQWRGHWRRVQELGCGTPRLGALRWLACPPQELEVRASQLLSIYSGSKDPRLNALWSRGPWGRVEKVALCAADESLLETSAQRRAEEERARTDEAARRAEQARSWEQGQLAEEKQWVHASLEALRTWGVEMDWALAEQLLEARSWEVLRKLWAVVVASPMLEEMRNYMPVRVVLEARQAEYVDVVGLCALHAYEDLGRLEVERFSHAVPEYGQRLVEAVRATGFIHLWYRWGMWLRMRENRPEEALLWLARAAEQGYAPAQEALAINPYRPR